MARKVKNAMFRGVLSARADALETGDTIIDERDGRVVVVVNAKADGEMIFLQLARKDEKASLVVNADCTIRRMPKETEEGVIVYHGRRLKMFEELCDGEDGFCLIDVGKTTMVDDLTGKIYGTHLYAMTASLPGKPATVGESTMHLSHFFKNCFPVRGGLEAVPREWRKHFQRKLGMC